LFPVVITSSILPQYGSHTSFDRLVLCHLGSPAFCRVGCPALRDPIAAEGDPWVSMTRRPPEKIFDGDRTPSGVAAGRELVHVIQFGSRVAAGQGADFEVDCAPRTDGLNVRASMRVQADILVMHWTRRISLKLNP
jgi:hypothetical protein